MKVSKIPGLGRFGVYVDDVDLRNISNEEWMEIGKIHLESLVTVVRDNDLDHATYYDLFSQWGTPRFSRPLNFYLKYGKPLKTLMLEDLLDENDKHEMHVARQVLIDKRRPGMVRVTSRKNADGESIGIFDDGNLGWHSNECSDTAFTPGVSLMGYESMLGSSTGFCTTADWFEDQSESFKSELRELITVNNYKPAHLNPKFSEEQEQFFQNNMCPVPNGEIPLIIKSPGGIEGVHLPHVTFDHFKGMNKEESKRLYDQIWAGVVQPEYIYDHWYQTDKDLLIFDNSITLHNRSIENDGVSPNRLALRIQFDYNKLVEQYDPYSQEHYNFQRQHRLDLMKIATEGITNF